MYNKSNKPKTKAIKTQIAITVIVYLIVSLRVGHVIFLISDIGPLKKLGVFIH